MQSTKAPNIDRETVYPQTISYSAIGVGATILPHRTPRPHRSRPAPWQAERDEHGCGHEVGSDAFTCLGTPALPIGLPHPASAQRSGRPPQTRRGVNLARSAVETRSGNCPAAQIANAPIPRAPPNMVLSNPPPAPCRCRAARRTLIGNIRAGRLLPWHACDMTPSARHLIGGTKGSAEAPPALRNAGAGGLVNNYVNDHDQG